MRQNEDGDNNINDVGYVERREVLFIKKMNRKRRFLEIEIARGVLYLGFERGIKEEGRGVARERSRR